MAKISITNRQLMPAYAALSDLAQIALPIKASYAVSRLLSRLRLDYEVTEKTRLDILTPLAKGASGVPSGTPEYDSFMRAYGEVLDMSLELDVPLLNLDQFGNVEVKPAILVELEPFILFTEA